jgi:hypothetical protein
VLGAAGMGQLVKGRQAQQTQKVQQQVAAAGLAPQLMPHLERQRETWQQPSC